MFFFRIPTIFKKKPVVKQPDILDKYSEDSYRLDVAILTVTDICKEYDASGMNMMAKEIHRQIGEKILQRGLRRWQV